jgi:hypothetical protein
MKKIILPLLVIITLYACKKSDLAANVPVKTLPDSNILVTGPPANALNSSLNIDKTYNLLGYGYDITGKYADTSAVRGQAINMAAFDAGNPNRVVTDLSATSTFNIINAVNAEDLSAQISARLTETNGLKQFKQAIVSPFADGNALSSAYVYGYYAVIIDQQRLKINAGNNLLVNYLTPSFVSDSQTLSAADLVKKYGTHVLSDIQLGAKFNIIYQAKTNSTSRLAAASAGFRYAIDKVFGLFSGALDPINTVDLNTVSSPKLVYEAKGADQSKLKWNTSSKTPTLDITAWRLSSTEASAAFIDISPNGLIPLDALISDPIKQAEVKSFISNYLVAQQVKLTN